MILFCAGRRKYFKCVQMIAGKMIKIIKRPPLHFVLEAKRATQILLGRMRKSLDFVPLRRIWINYWTIFHHSRILKNTIVKYVRNSGKNIQHSPDYMVMKPFERGVNFFIEGYLHKVGAQNHKESKTFYFRALCYRSLRKSEPPHKIRLAISTEQPYDVLASSCTCVAGSLGFCNHAVGLMYLVSHYSMTKAKMVHDDLHVNLKYNAWKISGSQSIAITTNDFVCDRWASVDLSI